MTDDHRSRLAEDSRRLKGLAHPVRARLMAVLAADGPMKVADLAAAVGEPANSVSFHVRQLEKYGLAARVEAPDDAPAGESWWGGVERSIILDPRQWEGDEGEAARVQLRELLAASALDRVSGVMAAIDSERDTGLPSAAGSRTYMGRLTNEEAADFSERLRAILEEMATLADGRDSDPGTRMWSFTLVGFPETRYGA